MLVKNPEGKFYNILFSAGRKPYNTLREKIDAIQCSTYPQPVRIVDKEIGVVYGWVEFINWNTETFFFKGVGKNSRRITLEYGNLLSLGREMIREDDRRMILCRGGGSNFYYLEPSEVRV